MPFLPALIVILSRRRRISVRIVSVRNMVKYQSAGKLPFGSQVSREYHFDLQPRTPFCRLRGTSPQGETRRYGIGFVSPVLHDEVL